MSKLIKFGNKSYFASLIQSISDVKTDFSVRAITMLHGEEDEISKEQKAKLQIRLDNDEINLDDRLNFMGYEIEFITEKENVFIGKLVMDQEEEDEIRKEHAEKLIEWESKI